VRGLILAWLIGEGIIVFRSVSKDHAPPAPGALIATSGLFILLAILAEYDPARFAATAMAFGVDAAALLNFWPVAPKQPKQATGTTQAPGTSTAAGRG
jgi:hypothetical protein